MGVQNIFLLFLYHFLTCQSHGKIMLNSNMRSFSHAQKEGRCTLNEEILLFERTGPPGVITEQWFAGLDCFTGDSIIRYYLGEGS